MLRPRFHSAMTRRTAGELLDLILLDQPLSQLELIGRRLVIDAEYRRPRADVPLGIPMTLDAPFHLERLLLPHQRHAIDRTVAGRASDPFVHVNAVVKVDEIGQIVDARPLDRSAGPEALAHRLEERTVRKDLRVTVHAGARRGNAGERRILNRRVTVAAIDAVARHVALVAELDRLFARDTSASHP